MSELRAPDPTLYDLGPIYVMLEPANDSGTLERAHFDPDQTDTAQCGWTFPGDLRTWLPGDLAAYIAVPCRGCFPNAPEPGHRPGCCGHLDCWGSRTPKRDQHLAWQVVQP